MKITITNVFGTTNRGDAVLVSELIQTLNRVYESNLCINGIASFPELERKHHPKVEWYERLGKIKGSKFKKALYHIYIVFCVIIKFKNNKYIDKDQLEGVISIKESDLVISCPGGFLQDSNLSYLSNLLTLYIAVLFNKKIIIAPQSIGPINNLIGRKILKYVLNKCYLICVREQISYAFLQDIGVRKKLLKRTTDLAFYKNIGLQEGDKSEEILKSFNIESGEYIAVSVVNWTFKESHNQRRDKNNYINEYSKLLKKLHERLGLKIFVVNQVSSDLSMAYKIKEKLGDYFIIDEYDRTPDDIIYLISNSKYFIGSRFHSTIFAILSHVPCITISYLPKTDGMMDDLNLEDRVFDIYNLSHDDMFKKIIHDLDDYSTTKKVIKKSLNDLRNKFPKFENLLKINEVIN